MALTIATKIDLQLLRQEMATKADTAEIRADVAELRQSTALLGKEIELLSTTMTVRLGSMLMLGLGLLFAALRLT
jgi:tetrahydromethanopterin S-methyltransferase subunit F